MANTYTPDRWVIVTVKTPTEEYHKVLASWYGGYTGSNVWKLSSGNKRAIERSDHWEFPQSSGSTYICYKNRYGMSIYTASIYEGWENQNTATQAIRIALEYELPE
jgi:hypothetical protein